MLTASLLVYDEGCQTLGHYQTNGTRRWLIDLAARPLARDLQVIGPRRALVAFDRGYFEVDVLTGEIGKVVDRWAGVTSVRRSEDGHTLVAGVNLTERPGITVLTLDPEDRVIHQAVADGDYVRLLRQTPQGTWLLGSDDRFWETTTDLTAQRALAAPGFRHAWLAHREPDGSTLVSAGYGAFLARFDRQGRLERRFGGAEDVPPEVQPFFYAMFEPLAGGLLVANWQGHGPDQGSRGRQLVQFDAQGRYVDSCSLPGVSSLQGFLILDQ